MLLRGIKHSAPALGEVDIQATRGRASRSGRSHGGAPLRDNSQNGRGRGQSINYGGSQHHMHQPQEVANQFYYPPGSFGQWPPTHGWAPPPPGTYSPVGYPPPSMPPSYGYERRNTGEVMMIGIAATGTMQEMGDRTTNIGDTS